MVRRIIFTGYDASNHPGLWVTDGTAAGTTELQAAGTSSRYGPNPSSLTLYGGKVLFQGYGANNQPGLWVTDGTAAGTTELQAAGTNSSDALSSFTLYGGKVLFRGQDASDHHGLWATDGTAAGTTELPVADASSHYGVNPSSLTLYGGKVLFQGYDASDHLGLWATDGTAAGTTELPVAGASSSYGLNPSSLTALDITVRPTLTALHAAPSAAGPLGTGRTVSFTLTPSEAVTVNTGDGSPNLALSNGGSATYAGQDASGNLLFTTAVAPGQDTADLKVAGFVPGGASVTDAAGNLLDALGLPALAGSDTGIVVDTIAPALTAALAANPQDANSGGITYGQVLAGGGDPNAAVTISESGRAIGTAQADAAGAWTYDPSGLAPGSHVLAASEADAAGNTGTAPAVAFTVPDTRFSAVNVTASTSGSLAGSDYSGPVGYLQAEYIYGGTDNVVIGAKVANVFLKSGAGMDALAAKAGSNVLDGGAGSNWLVGASGADGGTDTFFVDGRGSQTTWDTLLNFHTGDMLTLWGYDGATGSTSWSDNQGAVGYQGATLNADFGGGSGTHALVTFAGSSASTAQFTASTGTAGGLSYLAVTRMA